MSPRVATQPKLCGYVQAHLTVSLTRFDPVSSSPTPHLTPAQTRIRAMSGQYDPLPPAKRQRVSVVPLQGSDLPEPPTSASAAHSGLPSRPTPQAATLTQAQPHATTASLPRAGQPDLTPDEVNETHATRTEMHYALKEGKASSKNYDRHVAAYERYWAQYQFERLQRSPELPSVAAHPINATKASIFLKYESNRRKVWLCHSTAALIDLM